MKLLRSLSVYHHRPLFFLNIIAFMNTNTDFLSPKPTQNRQYDTVLHICDQFGFYKPNVISQCFCFSCYYCYPVVACDINCCQCFCPSGKSDIMYRTSYASNSSDKAY